MILRAVKGIKAINWRHLIPFFDTSAMDWAIEARFLRWLTFVWLFVGLAVMFSASYPDGDANFNNGLYWLQRQLIGVVVGMVIFNVLVHSPLRYIQGIADWFFFICLGGILLTILPGLGTTVNGGARWIGVGSFLVQPSEFIKPFIILQGARIFGQWERLTWRTRLTWVGIFSFMLFAILLQPNLSNTALCGMALWLIALAAGLPYLYLSATAGGGLTLALMSIGLREYQRRRIMSFLNPWADPRQDGYQLIQSLLAIGSGGISGTGFGLSQQKLSFLPEHHTDFIFAVFAEEFGLIGGLSLMGVLLVFATLALIVARKTKNMVHRLIAIGVMIFIVGQSLLHIGVATGSLPTTGLPLPLFSYGSNSMIASLVCIALLIRVARESSEGDVVSFPRSSNSEPIDIRSRRRKAKPQT